MSEGASGGTLAELLRDRAVVACLGAGGVGKTTLAAAMAVGLCGTGRRVLCLTIDPARRLADSLGLDGEASAETPVPPARLAEAGVASGGTLHVAQLDAGRTFEEVIRRSAPDRAAAERVLGNRLFRYLAGSLPGVQEVMALERLFAARADPRFDVVVLDTPPAANAIDFLEAPRRLIGAIDSPFAAWLAEGPEAGAALRAGGRGVRLVMRLLARLAGPGLLDEMAALLNDARVLLPGFRARAEQIDAALRSREVAFILAASTQPQAVDEAIFVHELLARIRGQADGFIVNRVRVRLTAEGRPAPGIDARVPAELAARLRAALAEHEHLAGSDEGELRRLMRRCGDRPAYFRVPAFDTDVRDLRGVAEVARAVFQPSARLATAAAQG